jgi:catalase
MPEPSPSRPPIGSLAIIAIVVAVGAGAFAYTAGWLSPTRLTPTKIVDSLAPPGGPSLGYRRNHAKGICFTGVFESNGNGAESFISAASFSRQASVRCGVSTSCP